MYKCICYENTESIIDSTSENGRKIYTEVIFEIYLKADIPNPNPY